jgi:hypothetical protein
MCFLISKISTKLLLNKEGCSCIQKDQHLSPMVPCKVKLWDMPHNSGFILYMEQYRTFVEVLRFQLNNINPLVNEPKYGIWPIYRWFTQLQTSIDLQIYNGFPSLCRTSIDIGTPCDVQEERPAKKPKVSKLGDAKARVWVLPEGCPRLSDYQIHCHRWLI